MCAIAVTLKRIMRKTLCALTTMLLPAIAVAGPLEPYELLLVLGLVMCVVFLFPFAVLAVCLRWLRVRAAVAFTLTSLAMVLAVHVLTDVGPEPGDPLSPAWGRAVFCWIVLVPMFSFGWWIAGQIERLWVALRRQ
jgi:hypothetical protein